MLDSGLRRNDGGRGRQSSGPQVRFRPKSSRTLMDGDTSGNSQLRSFTEHPRCEIRLILLAILCVSTHNDWVPQINLKDAH
jgi:hypothetical protein